VNARSVAHASSQKHGFYAYLRHEHHHEHAASDSDSRADVAIVDHAQHHLMRVMCIFCLSAGTEDVDVRDTTCVEPYAERISGPYCPACN
jgi:hypothetical protein